MSHEIDISFLDTQEITQKIFPLYFNISFDNLPQPDHNSDAYFIEVDEGVRVCGEFYVKDKDCPTILYFHGNGETALNQSFVASQYTSRDINLFVTDYRGYGVSGGIPSMTSLFRDCHPVYKYLKNIIKEGNYSPDVYIMGRSLGSLPAVELAYHYQSELKGLIIESGSAMNFNSLWSGADASEIQKLAEAKFYNKDKIREITIPTLIIHGEQDNLIPLQIGQALYQLSVADNKDMVIIPGAGHNDLLDKGHTLYLSAIENFVRQPLS